MNSAVLLICVKVPTDMNVYSISSAPLQGPIDFNKGPHREGSACLYLIAVFPRAFLYTQILNWFNYGNIVKSV